MLPAVIIATLLPNQVPENPRGSPIEEDMTAILNWVSETHVPLSGRLGRSVDTL
jgi:hypothetical protein